MLNSGKEDELQRLISIVGSIERLLYLVAARDSKIRVEGFRSILGSFDEGSVFDDLEQFPVALSKCQKYIFAVDRSVSSELSSLLKETQIESLAARLLVKLRLASNSAEHERSIIVSVAENIFHNLAVILPGIERPGLNTLIREHGLPVEELLASMARLKQLLISFDEDDQLRRLQDDDYFRPSGIDTAILIDKIDIAITVLSTDASISAREKESLQTFLEEAKRELVKETPSWQKVVGALVIVSTIVGGIAVAPEASENIKDALNYVLGTSVDSSGSGESQVLLPHWVEPQRSG